jgi:FAD synthase
VTFEPHPRTFFSPNTPQFKLTDLRNKLRLLAGTGLDGAVVMTFDAKRAGTTAQDFINHDLIERLGVSGISVGFDFHFGKGRAGSPALLAAEGPGSVSRSTSRAISMPMAAPCRPPRSAMRSVRVRSAKPTRCLATLVHFRERHPRRETGP